MNGQRVTDKQIEAALAETDIIPELCEWYDGAYRSVVFRIETGIGHYAQCKLGPWAEHESLVREIERTGREVSDPA